MKKKTLLSALLIFILLFSGCGKKPDNISTGEIKDGIFQPVKDMKISVWTTQGSDYAPEKQPKENVVENWLVEKTRVKVDNIFGNGGGQWESVLTRLIAGDNFPELVHCGGGQGGAHFARIAQADKIWELTPEILEKYAPDIWKKVPKLMWDKMSVDGKIYGIPYDFPVSKDISDDISDEEVELWGKQYADAGTNIWIRDDILKQLYPDAISYDEAMAVLNETNRPIGDYLCDVPINSTEDLLELMNKIQALNLKVENKQVYAFGYAGADCWVPYSLFGGEMMGYTGHFYTSSWNDETKEVRLPLLESIVEEGALIQNRLVRDKIIDPESLVNTDAQYKEKVLNGQYAMAILSAVEHPPLINAALEAAGKPYRYRPLYTQIPAAKGYEQNMEPISWGSSVGILKTVKEQDVPQILNWMNTQFTDEFEEIRYWGPKEAGLYKEEDGKRTFIDDRFNQKYIDHAGNALPDDETKGLNSTVGLFSLKFVNQSKWDPMFYNGVRKYELVPFGGGQFATGSKYIIKPIVAPPSQAWSAEFAQLELVKKYWSSRSQWEDPFKLALSAKSDEEFLEKWEKAKENLYSIVDVDKMLEEMTEIARAYEK